MSNDKSLMGENGDLASNDAFSAENVPEDNIKQRKEKIPAKKQAAKASVEPAKVEKPEDTDSEKKTIKKAPKKATQIKSETVEPKPAKAKTAAASKAKGKDSEQKPKSRKQPSVEQKPADLPNDVAVVTSVPEQQEITGEHSVTLMPPGSMENKETLASEAKEPVSIDTPTVAAETSLPVLAAEAAGERTEVADSTQSQNNQEPEAETTGAEKAPTEEQPGAASVAISPSEVFSSAVPFSLRKITFKVRFYTHPGQSLYVTGNHSLLGDGDIDNAFLLSYLNNNYWAGTLDIPTTYQLSEDITYNYVLKNADGTTIMEWGEDKVIQPAAYKAREVVLLDSWNSSSFIENTFYTEPFKEVLLKDNFTEVESKIPETVTHIFKVKAPLLSKGQTLCIIGSIPGLGEWDTEKPLLLSRKEDEVWYTISLDLTRSSFPFAYKYGVFDVDSRTFVRYEDGQNRICDDTFSTEKLTVVSDGFAFLPFTGFKGAGVAIPVFSLRSENSFGVGEFADMKLLVDWAKQAGLKLIQILPVNDTSATHTEADSYPYAAISAFALHPLYLHLPLLINNDNSALPSLQEKQKELNSKPTVDYVDVMAAKWSFIKQVFPQQKQQVFQREDFLSFFDENKHWLVPYAAFSYLKEKYNTSDFNQWPENSTFNAAQVNQLASSPLQADEEMSVNYYVQYHLHLQLREAADYAHKNGIILKGDIPIGIYRYSCDAWQEPHLFNMDMQAGAPPDDFAVKGQNWGFPTYNWQRMRENGFDWWKKRFKQMSYYFDAFRIDHILGFFRIWSIPMDSVEGIMGHFVPAVPVHINEFTERGIPFDKERFTQPYITDALLTEIFGSDREAIVSQFLESASESNYVLKPEFNTQRKIENYFSTIEQTEQNKKIKSGLFDLVSNVILFEAEGSDEQAFHFRIAMDATTSFNHLDGHTKNLLANLYVNYFYRRQDGFWRQEAMLKLPVLKRSTNMLICGEDLGMVPASVPGVMKELAILSLEIQRMPKDPKREFFHPNDAPYLSVVTPSTHDMSTIRGWWEEDRGATQRFYNNELGQWGTAPYFCEPWINRIILLQHFYSPAMWSIFQLQDLLGISGTLRRGNPHEERINIPADPKHYWRYRMHLTLEQLLNETEFTSEIRSYIVQSGR